VQKIRQIKLPGFNQYSIFGRLFKTVLTKSIFMAHGHTEEQRPDSMSGGFNILFIVLLLALVAALLWYFAGKPLTNTGKHGEGHGTEHTAAGGHDAEAEHKPAEASTASAAGKVDAATGDFIYEPGKMITIDLPNNGGKLEVGEYSTENKLFKFLSNKSEALDTVKGNWFEFTNVKFKSGGAVIDSSSLVQMKNIAAICKAFPAAQFKVGGYTDNSGDSLKNVGLSQKRADAVLAEFKKQGVAASAFTGAKGYGPEHPIGDNSTPEGRAMNRRVAVNVKAK
jgi:OmpA-OmpF porin, OOP family